MAHPVFLVARRDVRGSGCRPGAVSKWGVWLRRLLSGRIANSPRWGSDSAILPDAMLARHPISSMPPDGTHFLSLITGRGENRDGGCGGRR